MRSPCVFNRPLGPSYGSLVDDFLLPPGRRLRVVVYAMQIQKWKCWGPFAYCKASMLSFFPNVVHQGQEPCDYRLSTR